MPRGLVTAGAAILSVGAAIVIGCGGERSFTPEEFVEEINAAGGALALGPVITENEEGEPVRSVSFTEAAPTPSGNGESHAHTHGAATMIAYEDADLAREEFTRCETAPVLTCFRVANVVLRFEGLAPEDRARLVVAVEALQDVD